MFKNRRKQFCAPKLGFFAGENPSRYQQSALFPILEAFCGHPHRQFKHHVRPDHLPRFHKVTPTVRDPENRGTDPQTGSMRALDLLPQRADKLTCELQLSNLTERRHSGRVARKFSLCQSQAHQWKTHQQIARTLLAFKTHVVISQNRFPMNSEIIEAFGTGTRYPSIQDQERSWRALRKVLITSKAFSQRGGTAQ